MIEFKTNKKIKITKIRFAKLILKIKNLII